MRLCRAHHARLYAMLLGLRKDRSHHGFLDYLVTLGASGCSHINTPARHHTCVRRVQSAMCLRNGVSTKLRVKRLLDLSRSEVSVSFVADWRTRNGAIPNSICVQTCVKRSPSFTEDGLGLDWVHHHGECCDDEALSAGERHCPLFSSRPFSQRTLLVRKRV